MKNALEVFFDFLMPHLCASCKAPLNSGETLLCSDCRKRVKKVPRNELNEMSAIKFSDSPVTDFLSLYYFQKDSPIQDLIHQLKYGNRFRFGATLGEHVAFELRSEIAKWNIDYILPVPLHRVKKAIRGYNQSYYISKGINGVLRASLRKDLLKRKKVTSSQTQLSAKERLENVKGAFVVRSEKRIKGKNILLVDDVITTGATIKECAEAINKHKPKSIYALSIAIAE